MTKKERLRKVGEWLRGMILPDDCPVPALAGRCPVCGDEHWATKTPCERCLRLAADALERAEQQEKALATIDTVRNYIIGCQTVNWSRHIYPLVAALEEAGYHGRSYDEMRAEILANEKPPVCGENGYWCHGTCSRHGRCMYVPINLPESPDKEDLHNG